jgi:hypothetical protein
MTKPTPGPWKLDEDWDESGGTCIVNREHDGVDWDICHVYSTKANAELIIDAGNTYHATGLLPSELAAKLKQDEESDAELLALYRRTRDRADELAAQRDQLFEIASNFVRLYGVNDTQRWMWLRDQAKELTSKITNAKGKTE